MIEQKIIDTLNLDKSKVLRKPIRGLPGFNVEELIFAIINTSSMKEAATLLGYGEGPIKLSVREILIPLFPDRSAEFASAKHNPSWRFTLLCLVKHKHCNSCNKNLPFEKFYSHIGTDSTNLSSECSACHTHRTKLQKADIANRTPSWANLDKIREFYNNCPDGFHVDHIIPLRGTNVSGFHVETNLQYLWATDNISKGNKYSLE